MLLEVEQILLLKVNSLNFAVVHNLAIYAALSLYSIKFGRGKFIWKENSGQFPLVPVTTAKCLLPHHKSAASIAYVSP